MNIGIELAMDQLADMRASLLAIVSYLQPEAECAPTRARRHAASELVQRAQRAYDWLPASADALGSVGSDRCSRYVAITCSHCGHEDDAHKFLCIDSRSCPNCGGAL